MNIRQREKYNTDRRNIESRKTVKLLISNPVAGCCTLDLCRPVPSCELVRKMAGPPDFRENICQAGTLKPGNCHHDRFPFFFYERDSFNWSGID